MNELKYLEEDGLITFDLKSTTKDGFFMVESYELQMTPKGEKYSVNKTSTSDGRRFYVMKAADIQFDQLTQLIENTEDHTAQVYFNWSYTNITPFGVAANLRARDYSDLCGTAHAGDEYDEGRIFGDSALLIKGDGRWKIQSPLRLRNGLIQIPQ